VLTGGPDHDRLGFRYWKNPGPFVQYELIPGAKGRFLGWWAVLTQAAFSYIGTEIVAVSSHDACFADMKSKSNRLPLVKPKILGETCRGQLSVSIFVEFHSNRF